MRPLESSDPWTFSAFDATTHQAAEVRLLPWVKSNETVKQIQDQLQLSLLVIPEQTRKVIALELDGQPIRIVLSCDDRPLLRACAELSHQELIAVATSLCRIVERALTAGLIHGAISADSVYVSETATVRVDYLARFYQPNSANDAGSLEADVASTITLLQQLMKPLEDADWIDNGHRRGQLHSLLHRELIPGEEFERFDQWTDLLHSMLPSELQDERPAPSVVEDTTELAAGPVRPVNVSDSDGTCEVDIKAAPVEGFHSTSSDATSEVSIQGAATRMGGPATPRCGDTLGRFQLNQLLGEGGMGVVFRATDLASENEVALKILRPTGGDIGQAVRRFRKEARLLGGIQNEFVTRLIDSGMDGGLHYLAMEYVDGTNLKDWMTGRDPLDEVTALSLVSNVARALANAHEAEVIHRDIKPENILLGRPASMPSEQANALSVSDYHIKLSDFGIARSLEQSASMEVTRAGSLVGTPAFMSPEQCKGNGQVSPASDIYSLGITLYYLLTGTLPFESTDPMKLAAMHCFDQAPDVRKRNRGVSDATAELLGRMLAKSPAERPTDAAQLVRDIHRLLSGEAEAFASHPQTPRGAGKAWERIWEWNLDSSPEALWPHVSNTERINRAAGLKSVKYRTEKDPVRGLRKFGSFRMAGMTIEWEEHPFEWIEGQRMGILREFASGPFCWFMSIVELQKQPNGGTRLKHTVRIEPRNAMGRAVANIEAGWKGGRALDRIYRRIDASIQAMNDEQHHRQDPFEPARRLRASAQKRLQQRVGKMIELGVAESVAHQIGEYLRNSAPQPLARIRPLALADEFGVPWESLVDACFVAAHCGLLRLRWDILCPTCRAPAANAEVLSNIGQHTECEACDAEFQSDVANAIELVFQAHPEIREVDDGQYCIGGPEHSPHVVTQIRLEPQERVEIATPVSIGEYVLRGSRIGNAQPVSVRAKAAPSQLDVRLSQLGATSRTHSVRAGTLTLTLTNDRETVEVVRLERTIPRKDVITAAAASALPRFRELFPEQLFGRENAVAADELTLLSVRIASAESLYANHSDAEAYRVVQETLEIVERCIEARTGAVIKCVGESLLASFHDSVQALAAAADIQSRESTQAVVSAVHRGPLLVATQNGRLDYFGTTVRQVDAMCAQFEEGIALSEAIFSDTVIAEWLQDLDATHQHLTLDLPGAQQRLIQHLLLGQLQS